MVRPNLVLSVVLVLFSSVSPGAASSSSSFRRVYTASLEKIARRIEDHHHHHHEPDDDNNNNPPPVHGHVAVFVTTDAMHRVAYAGYLDGIVQHDNNNDLRCDPRKGCGIRIPRDAYSCTAAAVATTSGTDDLVTSSSAAAPPNDEWAAYDRRFSISRKQKQRQREKDSSIEADDGTETITTAVVSRALYDGFMEIDIHTGDLDGRAFVINGQDGQPIACGILSDVSGMAMLTKTMPVIDHDDDDSTTVMGQVTVLPGLGYHHDTSGSNDAVVDNDVADIYDCFYGTADGMEPNLESTLIDGDDCSKTYGCGTHILDGTSCDVNDEGFTTHYYDRGHQPLRGGALVLADDTTTLTTLTDRKQSISRINPWTDVGYLATDTNGHAEFVRCVRTGNTPHCKNKNNNDNKEEEESLSSLHDSAVTSSSFSITSSPAMDGKPFVIHGNDGRPSSCGLLQPNCERMSFQLWDASNDIPLGPLGDRIDLCRYPTTSTTTTTTTTTTTAFSIRAIAPCSVQVSMKLFDDADDGGGGGMLLRDTISRRQPHMLGGFVSSSSQSAGPPLLPMNGLDGNNDIASVDEMRTPGIYTIQATDLMTGSIIEKNFEVNSFTC